ncbi:hypothetical protein SNE40_013842 [Patella caerulea]|uniref:Uncharacterized protein n=1 Tax=Patella caerulea TaxID=87958 RepID=A0AAN8PBN0_PATCE
MQLTITTLTDQIFTLEVSEDLELENFKALCEFETGISSHEIAILWNGRPLQDNKKTLQQYGISNGEMLLLQQMRAGGGSTGGPRTTASSALPQIDFGSIQIPGSSGHQGARQQPAAISQSDPRLEDPETIRQMLLSNPHEASIIKERNPPLAEAINDAAKFADVFRKQQKDRQDKDQERIRLLQSNPFDPEAQRMIAEEIRLKNVESNMETAMEFAPESFGQVIMLYIDCQVNGHPVKAFVDSGAQMTIMSQACAERCNIMRLVDRRWAGIAKGVGTQRIIGRVHLCQIQIGPDFLQSAFSILEDQPMDMLLGLDMLRRHQCIIDMAKNELQIGTTGTVTKFLSESEVPEHARLNSTGESSRTSLEDEDSQLAQAIAKSSEEAANNKPSTSKSSKSPSTSFPTFPEEVVKRLISFNYSREAVLEELRRSNGDADKALAALVAKSFHQPKQ